MKILVSASACNPYQGSEPGVGWTAVCRIARDHDVFVLTDVNHREDWEMAKKEGLVPNNVQVRFIGKLKKYLENRFLARIQSWLWYAAYTRLVLKAAQAWHAEEQFNLCHQVTIAAWRLPSPLWKLPIPFVWGPIGGAGHIPIEYRKMLSLPARIFELARDIQTALAIRSPSFRNCIQDAAVIFAANEETEEFLRPFRGDRPLMRLPIVSISLDKEVAFCRPADEFNTNGSLQLFAGGNMEGRKGLYMALHALALVDKKGIDFCYTIAGGGPEIASMKKLANVLGISDKVIFHDGFEGTDYIKALQRSHVYFLPSFRESTPVTLIEAYLAGCYPVVADNSAQGEIVRMAGGTVVPLSDMKGLIEDLATAITDCSARRNQLFEEMEQGRKKLCEYFHSARYDKEISKAYMLCIKQGHS